jgi:hypothetical protein
VFHDYGFNYQSLVAPIFDYGSGAIWAHTPEQLDKMVTDHLLGRNANLQACVDLLRERVFGNLTDGRVKARMIAIVERLAGVANETVPTRICRLA